jgi:hypothetical protein
MGDNLDINGQNSISTARNFSATMDKNQLFKKKVLYRLDIYDAVHHIILMTQCVIFLNLIYRGDKNMAAKNESRFFIGQTIIDTRKTLKKKIDVQTKKHIKTKIKTSRQFMSDFKKDPGKQFDSFITEKKNRFKVFTKDSKKTYNGFVNDGKTTMKKVYKGVTSDARIVADDVKNISNKTIERKIRTVTGKVFSKLNLPSKKAVHNLMADVDGINKKVDKLNKLYA